MRWAGRRVTVYAYGQPADMRKGPAFAVSVAVECTDHLPLERRVRMMAREGVRVESQTLWDRLQVLGPPSRAHL
jgi:hypothetical protein